MNALTAIEPTTATASEPESNSVCFSRLDPVLSDLGQLIGLVEEKGQDNYCLNNQWFESPITQTTSGVKNNPQKLGDLLGQLLGQVGGHALGIPIKDPALLGTWYPIDNPSTGKPTGLYAVTYTKGGDELFGLGVFHKWGVPPSQPALQVDVWGMVPLFKLGKNGLAPVLDTKGFPITLGIAVEGIDDQPLVNTHGFAFSGVKFSAAIDIADTVNPIQLSIEVLKLKLPDEKEAKDRSLAGLSEITGAEIIATASSLFLAALDQVSVTASQKAAYLLPIIGLAGIVPNQEKQLPILRWDQLFVLAAEGKEITSPFIQWFTTIASDSNLLKLWLISVAGFLGETQPVTGDGSRPNPFLVPIIDLSKAVNGIPPVGILSFSAATLVDKAGSRHFYPGLDFQSAPIELGSSPAALKMRADLELAEFVLSGKNDVTFTGPSSIQFNAGLVLANKQDGQPLAEIDGYSFGSLTAGLALGVGSSVVPSFQLVDIKTPNGKHDVVNLLSPGELASAAEDTLIPMLESQLKKMMGIPDTGKIPFASNLTALLGIMPPDVPDSVTWPADQLPAPFSLQQLPQTIQDPVNALGNYYEKMLSAGIEVNGKKAFYFMLRELAGLLQDAASDTVEIQISGDGTEQSPWMAMLAVHDSSLPAGLTAFTVDVSADVTRLVLGLELAPNFTVGGIKIVPSLTVHFLSLDLPKPGSNARFTGLWAPDITAELALPDSFSTPPIASTSIEVAKASMLARWSRFDGWHWSILAGRPVLHIGDNKIDIGQDLNFSDGESLRDLVLKEAPAFSRLLTGIMGVGLLRTETRIGLFATGALGLLKDITQAKNYPASLDWPDFDVLHIENLSDPRAVLRDKIADDFSTDEKARAVLSLLAWAIDSTATEVPTVSGTSDFAQPFKVPLPLSGFELVTWFDDQSSVLGLGLGRTDSHSFGAEFEVTLELRLNMVELSLTDGKRSAARTPSLSLLATLANPKGKLFSLGDSSLDKMVLGFSISLLDGKFQFDPVVTLVNVILPGKAQADTLTLADYQKPEFTARLEQAFLAAVNEGIQTAIASVANVDTFKTAYDLLAALGLTIKRTAVSDPYGINPAGWQALLADPLTYAEQQLTTLLTDSTARDTLLDLTANILHVKLPTIPEPVLDVLNALDVLGSPEQGYPLRPQMLLNLVSHPLQTFVDQFEQLVNDQARRKALVTNLAQHVNPIDFGIFTFGVSGGTAVSLSINKKNAFAISDVLEIFGDVSFDLANLRLSVTTDFFSPTLGLAAVPSLQYSIGAAEVAPQLQLVWGDGTRPAAAPLTIFPFESDKFVNELADLAPAYVLNVIVNGVVESQLLEQYPLVQDVFQGLGIAKSENGRWVMPSLLGLLHDPVGWLLSEGILGKDGKFDIGSFGAILKKLPAVQAGNGLALVPTATGAKVTGLPYNFSVDLGSSAKLATIDICTQDLSIASGKGSLKKLCVEVSLDADYQPGIAGDIILQASPDATDPLFVEAGYDKEFKLKVGQGKAEAPDGLSLQILPFLGWGTLAEQAARKVAPELLKELTPRLLDALDEHEGAKPFVEKARIAGTDLEVTKLVDALAKTDPFTIENIEQTALDWLFARVAAENVTKTTEAINAVFQDILPQKLTAKDGLISYKPGDSLPLTLELGLKDELLGLWAGLELPSTSLLKVDIAPTGIGIPLTGDHTPQFSFGVTLTVPVDVAGGSPVLAAANSDGSGLTVGPQISLNFDQKHGFLLGIDPMGNSSQPGQHSHLYVELLPTFFPKGANDPDKLEDRVETWFLAVVKDVLPRYISAAILNEDRVHKFLEDPLFPNQSKELNPGKVLTASMLLLRESIDGQNRYYLNTIDALKSLNIETFLGNLLRTLLETKIKILSFGQDKKNELWIGPDPNDENSFGFRLFAPELTFPSTPNLTIRLGDDENKEWIEQTKADIGKEETGISIYLPIAGDKPDEIRPQFENLSFNLINFGFDFTGKADQPLVNMSRFKLGGVQPRGLIRLTLKDWHPSVVFGGGITLADMALSLTPNTIVPGDGGNPVAKNLLGSGSKDPEKNVPTTQTENPPTNPTFSVTVAYAQDLWVNLKSTTSSGNEVIIPVQRSFGPLYAKSIGLGWKPGPKELDILFSGSVSLAGLKADVMGLTVGIRVAKITDLSGYTLNLEGLDISFQGGSVDINGGLLKVDDPLSYTGIVLVKAASFSLVAIGSYAEVPIRKPKDENDKPPTAPSLFVFGALNAPLGGPPVFFITGVAAGFSYNRGIRLPDIGDVQNFPLVKGVKDGSFAEGEKPDAVLAQFGEIVPPEIGQYWLAAGIKFSSFELIDSFALLFVKFGREFEVDLLGLSTLALPKGLSKDKALAYVELALKVSIKPAIGIISVQAQLTPNSYIITKDCKLTGGFAFFLWFKNISGPDYQIPAGDFVITLGGYHPAFAKPKYYPEVPRLGFNWLISVSVGSVTIAGGAYFALTPTAVMAGGYLRVVFEAGPLRAWLDAAANFLIEWKPFYFDVEIKVSIGVSFHAKIAGVSITLSVELGADLLLCGPPTHGQAHVSWFIISFTIPIGEQDKDRSRNKLDWSGFEENFLPKPHTPKPHTPDKNPEQPDASPAPRPMSLAATAPSADPKPRQQVVKLQTEDGLLKNSDDQWLIRPVPFTLRVDSVIPTQKVDIAASNKSLTSDKSVGVRPMGLTSLKSPLTITIFDDTNTAVNLTERNISFQPVLNGAPSALWAKTELDRKAAPNADDMIIPGVLMGAALLGKHYVRFGLMSSFPLENLKYDRGNVLILPLNHPPFAAPSPRFAQSDQNIAFRILKSSIMKADVVATRNEALAALRAGRLIAPADPSLTVMAASADLVLQAHPILAHLGVYQNTEIEKGKPAPEAPAPAAAAAPAAPTAPELLGGMRRYQLDAAPVTALHAAALPYANAVSTRWLDADDRNGGRAFASLRVGSHEDTATSVIHAGGMVHWKIDARTPHRITTAGSLSTMLLSFNQYGELEAYQPLSPDANVDLLPETAQLVVQGRDIEDAPSPVGWQLDSVLSRVNHYYAVGDGFVLRTQNISPLWRNGRYTSRGLVNAHDLITINQVETTGGRLKEGWIETIIPGTWPTFAIIVESSAADAATDLHVSATHTPEPGSARTDALAPVDTFSSNTGTVLVYDAPTTATTAHILNIVAQPLSTDTSIIGVYALQEKGTTVKDCWQRLTLKQAALNLAHDEPAAARVTIMPVQ